MKNAKCKMQNGGLAFGRRQSAASSLPTAYRLLPTAYGPRRGVLLLIILGMLAMFGMIGIAFVILTGHAQRGATAFSRMDRYEDPPEKLLNDAFLQAVRGTENPASVLRPHSLLEDIYGNTPVTGQLAESPSGSNPMMGAANPMRSCPMVIDPTNPATWPNGGQLIWIAANTSLTTATDNLRCVGCVLTMLDGPGKGQSTRIVGYDYDPARVPPAAPFHFQILPFEGQTIRAADAHVLVNGVELSGNYVINGAPFSGTGFGYNLTAAATSPLVDAPCSIGSVSAEYALLPNPRSFEPSPNPSLRYTDPAGLGGANEDYDAVDFQNMLLAMAMPTGAGHVPVPIPSLHRPELVRYWMNHFGFAPGDSEPLKHDGEWATKFTDPTYCPPGITTLADWQSLKRRVSLRPLKEDHPNFTGSNPSFNPISSDSIHVSGLPTQVPGFNPAWDGTFVDHYDSTGTFTATGDGICDYRWDVDNDGDGVEDSIWVDLGMPVRAGKDGRLYKPLFAILCVDLDGRLNLNAHGCWAQTVIPPGPITPPAGYEFAGGNPNLLPRGLGYGPAEIDLAGILGANYQSLLTSRYPPTSATTPNWLGGEASHRLNANNWFLYGGDYTSATTPATVDKAGAYASPPDLVGIGAVGLDYGGKPLYVDVGQAIDNPALKASLDGQCPYEFDLSGKKLEGAEYTAFSPSELERLLRPYDIDAPRLPNRLENLISTPTDRRMEVTTESWDVPCPNVALPPDRRTWLQTTYGAWPPTLRDKLPLAYPYSVVDLLKVRLAEAIRTANPAWTDDQIVNEVVRILPDLIPPELLAGRKMDLNRALGDARDNNGNGVVDETSTTETDNNLSLYTGASQPTPTPGLPATYDPRGATAAANSLQARELYARYLYVLAMLLVNTDSGSNLRNHLGPGATDADVARFLAQWAVNVVDFYDADSIMTPFKYDPNPFTDAGWRADPDLTVTDTAIPTPHVVWGCERPELLITETLALHDRRTQDLATDNGIKTITTDPSNPDPNFDQQVNPEGSLFIELYNPWSDQEVPPWELYSSSGSPTGVELSKTAPGGFPVWRMIFVPGTQTQDPDSENPSAAPTALRSLYFGNPPSVPPGVNMNDGAPDRFYPNLAGGPILIPRGRYAVVGSADDPLTNPTTYRTTYLGRLTNVGTGSPTPPTDALQTRQIRLDGTSQGPVWNNLDQGNPDVPDAKLQPTVPIPIYQPRRLNISDPSGGYLPLAAIEDVPVDFGRADLMATPVRRNGTTANIEIVHLQRLANPLEAYDPVTNPYRTIDSMPIDLICFNGWDNGFDPAIAGGTMMCASHQRGEPTSTDPSPSPNALWAERLGVKTVTATLQEGALTPPPGVANYFPYVLHHSLGFMNRSLGFPGEAVACARRTTPPNLGDPVGTGTSLPFPWLTWNNRPFVSPLELLLVPWVKTSQLCRTFGMLSTPAGDPYANPALDRPFSHLLDFYRSDKSTVVPPTAVSPQLHRILEYVNVPSRFAGTTIQGDPATFTNPALGPHSFHAPFNQIPTHREPGKVNLNTIFSRQVYEGVINGWPGSATFDVLQRSRMGYTTGSVPLSIDPAHPTRFGNPFRSFAGASMVPLLNLIPAHEVDTTLLRESPTAGQPLFDFTQGGEYNNTQRNPYFYYQGLQRLGNLVTTRSNVYAVWITVGYFEVEPWKDVSPADGNDDDTGQNATVYQQTHPDGYKLGQELGSDTGEIQRHRAFFIFDRSVPMGFQRGKDLNVEKGVLIRRFVE